MEVVIVIAVLAVAIAVIVAPLRRRALPMGEAPDAADRAELEAAKEAKYREIRDAELDYRTGKLLRALTGGRSTPGCARTPSSCSAGSTRSAGARADPDVAAGPIRRA